MNRRLLVIAMCGGALVSVSGGSPSLLQATRAPKLIVYWSESPWPSIWSIPLNGTRPRRLLHNRQNAKRPRLSPDGRWVAFDGTPPGEPPLSDFDIQLVRLDGTGLRTVTHSPRWDTDAQWSPDERKLSFSRGPPHPIDERDSAVWVVDRSGRHAHRVAAGATARWSPDGRQLVYERPTARSRGQLFVIGVDGSGRRSLVRSDYPQGPVGWSPNGRKILFNRYFGTGSQVAIFIVDADGSHLRRIGQGVAAAWSPNGTILFTTSFSSALWTMDADGSHRRRIASVSASEPDWR